MKWRLTVEGYLVNLEYVHKIERIELDTGSWQVIAHQKHEAFILFECADEGEAEDTLAKILNWLNDFEPPESFL